MKYTHLIIFCLFSTIVQGQDYVPDENHLPPDEVQKQQERQEDEKERIIKEKKHQDIRHVNDPRIDKFNDQMLEDESIGN